MLIGESGMIGKAAICMTKVLKLVVPHNHEVQVPLILCHALNYLHADMVVHALMKRFEPSIVISTLHACPITNSF